MKALALTLIFCIASCADPSAEPVSSDAGAGTGGAAAAAGGHGGASSSRGGAGGVSSSQGGAGGVSSSQGGAGGVSSSQGGAGGVDPLSCAGCWNGSTCVAFVDQTGELCGKNAGDVCARAPLTCSGVESTPGFQRAARVCVASGRSAAYACPVNVCTDDACQPAVP